MVYLKMISENQIFDPKKDQIQRSLLNDEIMMLLDEITIRTIDHLENSHHHQIVFDVFKSLFDIELYLANEIATKESIIPQTDFAAKLLRNQLKDLYELYSYYNAFRIIILCRIDSYLVGLYEQASIRAKYDLIEALRIYNAANRIFNFYYQKFHSGLIKPELNSAHYYHYKRMLNECMRIFDSIRNSAEKMKVTTRELFSIIN